MHHFGFGLLLNTFILDSAEI